MSSHSVIHDFSNIGFVTPGRIFAGFPKAHQSSTHIVEPRGSLRLNLEANDLVSITGNKTNTRLQLAAFSPDGEAALSQLNLTASGMLKFDGIDAEPLLGWIKAQGGNIKSAIPVTQVEIDKEPIIIKSTSRLTLWLMYENEREQLISGFSNGAVTISHQHAMSNVKALSPELGEIRDEFTVTRGTGVSYELKKGEIVQIIDIEGQQCSDFMALRMDGLDAGEEWLIDSTATRSMVRQSYPSPGGMLDKFYDREMRPLMQVLQDTCGRHDTFGLACTARGYEERGFPGHVNCSDNISNALANYGVERRSAWPAINFFWNTWVDPHSNHIMTEESHSRPGDYVAIRAMENLVCVSTACPDDIDPINGWNPTDIYVRIYRPDAPIRRAVAYRDKEDAPMSISQESAFHDRLSSLTKHFAPARDLWTPVSFPSHGTIGEYWACRQGVTIQDMSGLRKYDILGPDAAKLLQLTTTRNVEKLPQWRGSYTLMCDETGSVIDDGTLFRLGDNLFRWCCGSEESGRVLDKAAFKNGLQARVHALGNALPNLALQGPRSRDLLRKIVFTQPEVPALDHLKWFGVTVARLKDRDGAPFMLSRSGYTGELGYEIFCAKTDAVEIWDALIEAGDEFGITPMGSAALEIIRIEAGLAAANAEFAPGIDALEAGLGFAVDMKKVAFTGRSALERNAENPRRILKGLIIKCDDIPVHGAPVFDGERQIGVVTSATHSPSLECGIAIARLAIEHAENGGKLEIGQLDGRMKRLGATVTNIPFIDPQRMRARA